MKQGTVLNRIVMLVLFAAVLFYLGVSAWQGFTDRTTTVVSYAYTLDTVQEATGYLAREEYVLPVQSGLADVLPGEGEKVAVGQTVAYLYRDAAALERKQEIRGLNLELEQLAYSLSRTDDLSDNAKLTREIVDQIVSLRSDVANRDFTSLEEQTMDLKNLVYKRDYTYEGGGDLSGIQSTMDAITVRRDQLTAAAAQDTTAVTTDRSGVFSGLVDGYENVLTPALLETVTPSTLRALSAQSVPAGSVGKLVTSSRWYFVCSLPESQTEGLAEGFTLNVRFSRDWAGEVKMEVERMSDPENGQVAVVFSSTEHLSETTLLRRQTVDIVFSSVTGIRVPKNALYQDAEGRWGVYAVVGAQAEFKPVTVVGQEEDYYLVEPQVGATDLNKEAAKKALRPGDEIVITAEELFDGKVIRK